MILNVINTPTNGVCFYGDSVISSYNVENNPHVTTWTLRLFNDPAYNYPGDLVSESYAGKILSTDLQTDEQIQAVAAKLASFPVTKYWFEGGFNDYAFSNFADRPDLTLVSFTDKYQKLIDYLHDLKPTAKIFVQTIVETYYTLANGETVQDPDANPLVYTGPTAEDYRMVQRIISGRRSSYCEFVDFTTEDSTFKGVYGETPFGVQADNDNGTSLRADIFRQYVPDGAHPNIEGSKKWAEAVKKRSSLFAAMTNPLPMAILTQELPTSLNPNAHKQTNLKSVIYDQEFSHYLTASNGFGAVTYAISGPAQIAGLTFNTTTGHLSGTPTAAVGYEYNFTITATDATGRTATRTFAGIVGDAGGGSVPGTATISYASVVSSDVYDTEWYQEAITGYSLVNKTSTLINPTSNPSSGKAGLFSYFASGNGTGTGNISFTARGTGVMEVIVFNSALAKVARQTFTLTETDAPYSMAISLTPESEYRLGIFFSGDGSDILADNARDVVIAKSFSVNFTGSNFYGLTGNYIRLRWDETSILGNGYTNWSGRKSFSERFVPAKKFFKHSSWAFMRLKNCDATKLVVEYVNATPDSVPLSVFENNTMVSFITYAEAPEREAKYYKVQRKSVTLSNPGVMRTIEVVSSGQQIEKNGSVNTDHMEFATGAYIRAIYIEEGALYSLDTTPHPESISFIGDSIINTMDPVSYINNPSAKRNWIHDIKRNGSFAFNYQGDIFTDSSSSRSLGQDIQDPTRRENLVQRLLAMGAKKIYIEGSTNDFWASEPGRTYVQSSVFKANYKLFVDRLLEVIPGCMIYMHVQYRFSPANEALVNNETPVGLTFSQWRQKVRDIYNENYASNNQVALVDFETVWTAEDARDIYLYPDGLHPKYDNGQALLAQQLIARSTIEEPLALSFSPITAIPHVVVNTPFSRTFTAINGTAPYTYSVIGTLPGWLSLFGNVLSGTAPATVGSSTFSIRVTDNVGSTFTKEFTVNVTASAMLLTPSSLAGAVRGSAYSQALSVTGNIGTVSYSATGLPAGLTINTVTGLISGTPTVGNTIGNYTVNIQVTDSYNTQTFTRTLALSGVALTVSPSSITDPVQGVFFSQAFTASGGTAPYTYSVSGQPTGLTMSSGGTLSGTPSATGSFTFTVTATDSIGNTGTRTINTTVAAPPKVVDYNVFNSTGNVAVAAVLNKPGGGGFSSTPDFRTIVNVYRNGTYLGNGFVTFPVGSTTAVPLVLSGVAFTSGTYEVEVTLDESYSDPRSGPTVFQGVTLTYNIPDITVVP